MDEARTPSEPSVDHDKRVNAVGVGDRLHALLNLFAAVPVHYHHSKAVSRILSDFLLHGCRHQIRRSTLAFSRTSSVLSAIMFQQNSLALVRPSEDNLE
jgi:hypothetical protein